MRKYILDWQVKENILIRSNYFLLKLRLDRSIPESLPGQFVQVRIKNTGKVFLRRPISIHYIDKKNNELWLLIQIVGEGTRKLSEIRSNEFLNLIFPLGKSFTIPANADQTKKLLLIGGGVGIAPLLYLGACLKERGMEPIFLLGAKTENDLLQLKEFENIGQVYITTENGHLGEKGFVINHSVLQQKTINFIYSCGPKPMMRAVAQYARQQFVPCEVSLENTMACGIGACLCCVGKTTEGHVCVCTEGPVFNIAQLAW